MQQHSSILLCGSAMAQIRRHTLPPSEHPDLAYLKPHAHLKEDIKAIYKTNNLIVGEQKYVPQDSDTSSFRFVGIIGGQLGDEGKGRIVDNKISLLLENKDIKQIYVIRFNGGSNAGHTIEQDGIKLALHQVPSGVFHKQALGIMDTGMAINVEDLATEVSYIEKAVGSLLGRLFLSERASLNTDLERALEWFNNQNRTQSQGGTSRGISPTYSRRLDRTGLIIRDLVADNWKTRLGQQYSDLAILFKAHGIKLSSVVVPDFTAAVKKKQAMTRKLGSRTVFLERLDKARTWLLKRKLITDTIALHEKAALDPSIGVLFEGAQGIGLDPWLGTWPDVTSSPTTFTGITTGTGFYTPDMLLDRIAIIKHNPSSVGKRRMPTHIPLPQNSNEVAKDASSELRYAAWIREIANERGTTTGRYRDLNYLDLPFLIFNLRVSGANQIGITHLDIAKEDMPVKVCYSYKDNTGNFVRYRPDLAFLEKVVPLYTELPGWSGELCQKAKRFADLPENAKKYLAFIQKRTGYPITILTTGAAHANIIEVPQIS